MDSLKLEQYPAWFRRTMVILFPLWFLWIVIESLSIAILFIFGFVVICLTVMPIVFICSYGYYVGWKGNRDEWRFFLWGGIASQDENGNWVNIPFDKGN